MSVCTNNAFWNRLIFTQNTLSQLYGSTVF